MPSIYTVAFVILGLWSLVRAEKDFDPMVAFICNKGAMHMDPNKGWSTDGLTDCIKKEEDILSYCKKVYPTLDITNIVASTEIMAVKGWCPVGKNECAFPETYKVRPFRCLKGAFQSDALVVPKKCVFDHIHNRDQCHGDKWWADVAQKSCQGLHDSMRRESYAMLIPCGVEKFTGVEFVCCPSDMPKTSEESAETSSEEDTKPQETSDEKKYSVPLPKIDVKVKMPEQYNFKKGDVVEEYLHQPHKAKYENEHDAFTLAKKELLQKNHDKITQLMKEWSDARHKMLKLKSTDPKGAEKLNRELTSRYQKEYFAIQTSGDSKLLQLDSIHQNHVQTNLNTKKRKMMEQLMIELQAEFYDPENIMKYLQKYIATEQKDAHHCIQHYLKIRDRDAMAAQQLLPATVEHLTLISTRINQSIALLHQLKDEKIATKLETSIRAWLIKSYSDLDKTISTFTKSQNAEPTKEAEVIASEAPAVKEPVPMETNEEPSEVNSVGDKNGMTENMYKKYAEKLALTGFGKKVKEPEPEPPVVDDEAEIEQEHTYVKKPEANNYAQNQIHLQMEGIGGFREEKLGHGLSAASTAAIAIGVVAAVVVVVFSVMVVKRRAQRHAHPSTNTYLEVAVTSPELTPEDKHILTMQNGYENPTYKLLERKA